MRNFSTFAAILKILNPQCIAMVVRTPPVLELYRLTPFCRVYALVTGTQPRPPPQLRGDLGH